MATKLPPYADPMERMKSIGSSDIGVILGVSKYLSPVQLWMQKRGELEPQGESEVMRWGKILEEPIAREYTNRTGTKLKRRNKTQHHKLYDYFTSHIDREAIGRRLIVEVKAHGIWGAKEFGDEGSSEVPASHEAQVTWQMGITGIEHTDFAVLIGGQKFCQYHVDFDPELFAMMLERAQEFWARVQEGRPPEPESEADCKALWSKAKGVSVQATLGIQIIARAHREATRDANADEDARKFEVLKAMGECDTLLDDKGNILATNKNTPGAYLDQKGLKADHPELHAKYMRKTNSRKLLIKERKDT